MNKTTVDGNVIISGDHNEVILSISQETKKALAAIKSELYSLNERDTKFAHQILSLKEHMGIKLDLMNKSNAARSVPSSETQGQLVGTGKSLKPAIKNSGEEIRFRLFPVPTNCPWVSEDGSVQVQMMAQRLTTLEKQGNHSA